MDRRGVLLLTVFLTLVSGVAATMVPAAQKTTTSTAPSATEEPVATVWLDRTTIKPGERATLIVVLHPDKSEAFEPQVFLSDALELTSGPMSNTNASHSHRRYSVLAKRSGVYGILVRCVFPMTHNGSRVTKLFERTLTLTVRESGGGILAGNAGVIIGAALGIIGSFLGLYFKEWMENRATRAGAVRWLSNELVGRLEVAGLEVRSQRSVAYTSWMEELKAKYFAALRKYDSLGPGGAPLSRELVEIEGLLWEYNRSLAHVAVDDRLKQSIDARIRQVVECLGRIGTH